MSLLAVLAFVGAGLVVGLLSGLIGIGGGVLMVPLLYFCYEHPEWFGMVVRPEARTVLAHGTSLFVIMPTAARGALAFHRARLVEWRAVWPIGLVSVIAALFGARLALALPAELLKVGFGTLLIASGVRLGTHRPSAGEATGRRGLRLSVHWLVLTGVVVGLFSALLGVGGGIVAIPLLIHLLGVEVRKVAATSIGIISITAAAGAAAYMWGGLGEPGLPRGSLGYVHVSAGLLMFLGAVVSVRWGAALNQRLRPRTLTWIFAALFILLGGRLVLANGVELWAVLTGAEVER